MAFSTPSSSAKRRYRSGAIADINMLPMIDVMMVLLIMFMVAAPLLTHAVKVNLPKASSSEMPVDAKPISITVQADSVILLNQQAHTLASLKPALTLLVGAGKPPAVQIYADQAVPYGLVAQVMGALSQSGLSQLRFASLPTPSTH
jgi:biopolymer transport protein ExbD